MFRIGEFAQIAQVSGRLLRYYDQLDLLRPGYSDPQTGYRYYSARQLPRLNAILALKELGLSLEQIGGLLDEAVSTAELRGMLMLKRAEAEQALRREQARLRLIESRIRQIDEAGALSDYDVVLKAVPAQPFLAARRRCTGMAEAMCLLRDVIAAATAGLRSADRERLVVVARPDFDGEELDLEAGFTMRHRVNRRIVLPDGDRLALGELPAVAQMATVVRSGPGYQSHLAFGSLGLWIEANGYRIDGPSREAFLDPADGTPPDSEAVVEIQFPVRKAD